MSLEINPEINSEHRLDILIETSDPNQVDRILNFVVALIGDANTVHMEYNGNPFIEFRRRKTVTPLPESSPELA